MKICSKCNKENNNDGMYCVFCGEKLIEENDKVNMVKKIEKKKIKQKNINELDINQNLKIILIILTIILLLVSGLAIYFKISDNTSELEKEIASLEKQIRSLKNDKEELTKKNTELSNKNNLNSKKIKFFDENVVFVLDGYGRYYYTYDQMAQVTQGKPFSYWAYNLEQAIDLGYRAWK